MEKNIEILVVFLVVCAVLSTGYLFTGITQFYEMSLSFFAGAFLFNLYLEYKTNR